MSQQNVIGKRQSRQLPVSRARYEAMVRQAQQLFDQIIDDLNTLSHVMGEIRDTQASVVIAAHAPQHQAGGGDEVYFSTLERSATDPTQHDAYRGGPHITTGEQAILAGNANLVFNSGFYPIVTEPKGAGTAKVKLVPVWRTSPAPGYWAIQATEVP